jgi:2-polyprenyl-3-methyl-5-hydroxy-6-metoxy-1,4-benzoquinol methylase
VPKNQRVEAVVRLTKGHRVLHVGCADHSQPMTPMERRHWLHAALVDAGHSVLGADINQEALQWMNSAGYEVIQLDAEHIPSDGERFDAIVAGELIEHLENPGLFLRGAHSRVRPGGRMILTTPNAFGILGFLAFIKNDRKAFNPQHTCWFDAQTLEQLLVRCNYRVNSITYVDDIRAEIDPSRTYRVVTAIWRAIRWMLPRRFRNTLVVDASPVN